MKKIFLLSVISSFYSLIFAQSPSIDSLSGQVNSIRSEMAAWKRLKISGYVQPQFQYADSSGMPAVGGNFARGTDKRFSVRRGRIKFQYSGDVNKRGIQTSQYVLQFDVTEKGVAIKDAYARMYDPWTGWFSVTAGMFNRPFGFEIGYSSRQRESPERARAITLLFPGERELGASLAIQGPRESKWRVLKFEAGLFNGNGAPGAGVDVSDFDKKKDVIGKISYENNFNEEKVAFGAGFSFYKGGYRIDSVNVFKNSTGVDGVKGFKISQTAFSNGAIDIARRDYTDRQYIGADLQLGFKWHGGNTIFRSEFVTGKQPGFTNDTRSPNDRNPVSNDIYYRDFNAAVFYLIHAIGNSPFTVIAKYDWYDPNTDVKKNEIGREGSSDIIATNSTDLRYDTFGLGGSYTHDSNLRITAYYDIVTNEFSTNLSGYTKDRKDNLFTLRMQVSF